MKVFLIEFGWGPGNRESCVLYAETPEQAIELAEIDEGINQVEAFTEGGGINRYEYKIKEVKPSPGVIYDGYYCC